MVVREHRDPARPGGGVARVEGAVARIRAWGEAREWRGYDPYDGLNSPLAGVLSLGTPLGRRLVTQAVKLSPLNLRPLLGIRREWNAKAVGLVAAGYTRLAAADPGGDAAEHARRWLDWLVANAARDGSGLGWGYHFDVQTRVFSYPRGTPNTIATSFVAHALLDAVELTGDDARREPASAAAGFLRGRMVARDGSRPYFRYLPGEGELVHNANLLGCSVLARAARVLGETELLELVAAAVETSTSAQRPDGSWPYAAGGGHDWVDNFHTAYVLQSLAECARVLPELAEPLARGVVYWREALFLPDGTPKYYPERVYPLDAHCYADAIETYVSVGDLAAAERQSVLLVERMLDPSGYVHFQQWPRFRNRVPLIRWSTAPSFRSLAGFLLARARQANAA